MNKEYILAHIDELTVQQLAEAIIQEKVTLEELRVTGFLDATKRNAISNLLKKHEIEDHNAWYELKDTKQGCIDYLEKFPFGKYYNDAKEQIDDYDQEEKEKEEKRKRIIKNLTNDKNFYTPGEVKNFLNSITISPNDLLDIGFSEQLINSLNNIVSPQLNLGLTPNSIPDGYTEVYFWGIPGSGKTCALAAILSTANKEGFLELAQGPGFDYMVRLKSIFSYPISVLPNRNTVDTTQYLPFTLKKKEERYARSISLIELSGEIFQCFLYKNAGKPLPSQQHEITFDSLLQFLNGNNRKIHFFFVDYNVDNLPDSNGYCQSDYLESAAIFFNNKSNNLFSNTTDAIYIVLTKSDLIKCEKNDRVNHVKDHLKNNNFNAFVESLKSKCRENGINASKLLATHFALGNVYLNQLCEFDPETSYNIIDILMRRIAPTRNSILDVFNK